MSADEKHHRHHHFTSEEKTNVVIRALGGVSRDALAEELQIPVERIAAWESTFLDGGRKALSSRHARKTGGEASKTGGRILQWSALLLLLLAVVYFLTRFMESSGE
jgi:hypothetical protein